MIYVLNVGVNKYSPSYYGKGNNLSQCITDATRLNELFETTFKATSILLKDSTAKEFTSAIDQLTNTAKENDLVVITVSSHGTYQDTGNKRATGLCMTNKVVWDYEVRELIKKFAKGVRVLVITDACHSESTFRLLGKNAPEGLKKRFLQLPKAATILPTKGSKTQFKCAFIHMASCNIYQPSYETKAGGAWTNALLEAIEAHQDEGSYYKVFQTAVKVLSKNPFQQSPVLDHVKADTFLKVEFGS
jgi:hypothetical protein